LSYERPDDIYKVTKVTDPFATFDYQQVDTDWSFALLNNCPTPSVQATATHDVWLAGITDVIGLTQISGTNVTLTWTAVSSLAYRLEFNPSLIPSN